MEVRTREGRVYRAYLFEDELPVYRMLVREFTGTERLLQYHVSKVLSFVQGGSITSRDVQAIKLVARGGADLLRDYDVRRPASVVEAILTAHARRRGFTLGS